MAIIPFPGDGVPSELALITAPQTLTGAWANLGDFEIPTDRAQYITVYFALESNDSKKVRTRVVGKHSSGSADVYTLHAATRLLAVKDEYYEFPDTSDKQDARFELLKSIPIVQVQVMAFTPGVTPGRILSARIALTM